ncbi:uncharacterized protein CDV56_104044 [Aspergillus thermomutatus]|uniref:Protein efr3 n=1 Tax=Aspergillus thermomutatus TaxID=41047 RepID=A0A397GBG8_ASPTH|nr:uncharacterized protein CDV56_104044 [Aspergillus thermomutatus]RHZ45440.1 hypothetical protein CDV56_104044 [Aspergillus thermomutatus]
MESVRQSCRPKHQVLVLKCYPQYQKGVQDVKPNSSELSYLLYYVSTRRSKLTKVGAFLEKRAARDVWRNKLGNVQVTLQILTALIEKVPRDLPIYARSVMTVLETVLRSGDISMVEESISTFETFCRHQDMAALSAEQDFASQYREVVRTYADFADQTKSVSQLKTAPSGPMVTRWRTAGLRAIKGVVSSEAGLAADGGDSLRILLPVILDCLYNGDDSLLVSLELRLHESEKNEPALGRRRRISTATVQTVDAADGDPALASQSAADVDRQAEMDMRLLALRCLERIVVTGSSRGQIRVTTKVVLQFILSKGPLSHDRNRPVHMDSTGGWATSLVELIAKWCPVQVRFIILISAMEMFLEVQPTEETLQRSYVLIYLIDGLLKSPVNMIGLSVIDILLGLMQFMSILLSQPASAKSTEVGLDEKLNDHDVVLSAKKLEVLGLLQRTMGDLTTHIYYGDQVVDTIRTILTRMKPSIDNKLSPAAALPTQSDNTEGSTNSAGFPGEMDAAAFTLPIAKVTALRAIKDILSVANSNRRTAAGVETRNPVGIHAWEGTQWLLREPDRETRHAYIDAFLTWLTLETTQDDTRARCGPLKGTGTLPRRESPEGTEKAGKQPLNVSQREKVIIAAQFNFLRLFHLTIYDIALDCPTDESEILLLHLLLTSLVERLGVNAVRFGLPMVLKLQEDIEGVPSLRSPAAKVNIGSLIHGYLWAMSEKFEFESYRVGNEITREIERRKQTGLWLDSVRVPATRIDGIIESNEKSTRNGDVMTQSQLIPFKAGIEELVNRIEEAYNSSMTLAAHSPPGPGHNYALPVLGHGAATASSFESNLPSSIKEQMLTPWSREACLAAAEEEKAEAMSVNGSRHGTLGLRNHPTMNGAGNSSHSTTTSAHQSAFGAAAGLQHLRRMSVPGSPGTPLNGSGRESPVRVNELRRVLSVNAEGNARRLSPLRGRLDASNGSIVSSSSESMVSGFSLSEYDVDGNSIRPQSIRDGRMSPNGDGMETPKASSMAVNGVQSRQSSLSYKLRSDGIPPVPPIPPSISIPGGFSNDAQRSLPNGERPSTAPGLRQVFTNGKHEAFSADNQRTLSRHKSRSSTGLAAAADAEKDSYVGDGGHSDATLRRDVQNLINGFLSPMDAESRHGGTNAPARRARSTHASRRRATGGIGRPPY